MGRDCDCAGPLFDLFFFSTKRERRMGVLPPKVGKKGQATSSKMAHPDEMAPKFVFKKSDQHQQGGCIRGWATREEEAAAE